MCYLTIEPDKSINLLDIAFKSATILIAMFNAYFAIKLFRIRYKKDDTEKERDRKMQLLKTLVLDHSLIHFYSIFDEIETALCRLKFNGLTLKDKQDIDAEISLLFIKFRRKFYDSLIAIDVTLYSSINKNADEFQTSITNTMFDEGVNLSHSPKYEELIIEPLVHYKSNIIKILFSYRG